MRCHLFGPLSSVVIIAFVFTASLQSKCYCAVKPNPDSLSRVYSDMGYEYGTAGNFTKAGEYFLKSIKLYSTTENPDSSILGARYYNLGSIMQQQGFTDSALAYYSSTVQLLKPLNSALSDLAIAYVEMGNCFLVRHEYQEAVNYTKQGIAILSAQPNPDYSRLVVANFKLSNTVAGIGNYDDAISIAKRNIVLAQKRMPKMLSAIYTGLGNTYLSRTNYEQAMHCYKLAEKSIERGEFLSLEDASHVYNNIGFLYRKLRKWEYAERYLEKSLASFKSFTGSSPSNIAQVISNIGEVNSDQKKYTEAIGRYQKALSVLRRPVSLHKTLALQSLYYSSSLAADIDQNLGDAYLNLFSQTKSSHYALKGLACFKEAIALVENSRIGLLGEEDKLRLSERYNEVFNKAVGAALILAQTNNAYVDVAFRYASKGKAAVLSESLRRINGLSMAGVPPEVQAKEQMIRQRIGVLSEMIYEEQKKKTPSKKYLESIDADLFGEQERYRLFLKSIETHYPKYYAAVFDTSSVSIKSIQKKLKTDQVYVEYVVHDSVLYTFAICCSSVHWKVQAMDAEFHRNLVTFKNELVPTDFGSVNAESLNRFAASSFYLYSKLLLPFRELIKGKTLIVAPHNELTSIPFCALLTAMPIRPKGYYALPYLIKSNALLVSLSSKEFVGNEYQYPKVFASSLSVAPSYKGSFEGSLSSRAAYREKLPELYGAEDEVKWVSQILSGDVVVGKDASETSFKRFAGNYDILHLAMHTFVDEKNPIFSKLIFFNSSDSVNDSYLNAYEVYGLKLNARLAILSACRSGDGSLVKGEGLMSLSRGFQYAGCPAMVVTQWLVDDFSGGAVVKNFARALKDGYSKSYSLRRAQLEFLESSDPLRSHPYFWAGYQVVGADDPVFVPLWQAILPFLVILIIGLQFFVGNLFGKTRVTLV
ncbi:CHAT domain-containing protein [Williamwhitmania taraxaci]|uniref:CHAT domain-containing protein n=1 Tax=Williamwhitmania taraxaci TaxID=1640674 RepID=A0A1G6PQ38_9BACT|nr:CHAT domain-containing tetratricopeptide repeat protein [Williamwhitmania taraxaci]SDC81487.1 CHAT domain-containing protein [Williamwhitmania taraxaci]